MRFARSTLACFGAIVLCWIVILAIPILRGMFLAQTVQGGVVEFYTDPLPSVIPPARTDFSQLSKKHPDSLALKLRAIAEMEVAGFSWSGESGISPETISEQIRALPDLFPDSPLALAYCLNNYYLPEFNTIRRAGELEDYELVEHREQGSSSPERVGERNYTQEEWREVIELCKRGQRLDPQNAYFDVQEAYWQFAEFHDAASWKAIQRAGEKATFNTYALDYNRSNLEAYERAVGRSLYWEEARNATINSSTLTRNFNTGLRHLGNIVEWEGIKAQRREEHEEALRIYNQLFDVMHLWHESTPLLEEKKLANLVENMMLKGPWNAGVAPDENTEQREATYSAFRNYALSVNRPDQLRYIETGRADYKTNTNLSAQLRSKQKSHITSSFVGYLSWRISVLLLLLLIGGVITGLISLGTTKVLSRQDAAANSALQSKDFWPGALAFMALPASLGAFLCYAFALVYRALIQRPDSFSADYGVLNVSPYFPWQVTFFGVATGILFSLGFALRRTAIRYLKPNAPGISLWQYLLGGVGSILFVLSWVMLANGRWPFLHEGDRGFADFLSSVLPGAPGGFSETVALQVSAAGLFIGLGIYLFNTIRQWRSIADASKKTARYDLARLLNGSALRWLALGSVLYLLTLVVAVPARAPLHEYVLSQVEHGEVASLSEPVKGDK